MSAIGFTTNVEIQDLQGGKAVVEFHDELTIIIWSLRVAVGDVVASMRETYTCRLLDEHHVSKFVPSIGIVNQTCPIIAHTEWAIFCKQTSQATTTWPSIGP